MRQIAEDNPLVHLSAPVQRSEDRIPDRNRHPGRLVRVDDQDLELQKPSLRVVLAVSHRILVLGVYLVQVASLVVALHLVGQPRTSLGKLYVSRHSSVVHSWDRSRIISSKMLGRSSCTISRTNSSLFSAHGRSSNLAHLICTKSCLSSSNSIGFSGMLGITFRKEIVRVCGGSI